MFKNAKIYRLTSAQPFWNLDALNQSLEAHAYTPAGELQLQSVGWVPPREGASLAHPVGGKLIMTLRIESKLLPSKAINQAAAARAREFEEKEGYKPGRKLMKEIRERIIDEKLPTALTQYDDIRLWVDPADRWLVIDTSTPSKADLVVGLLAKSIEPLPLENLYVVQMPAWAMTAWLASDEPPANFSIDQDAELKASGASAAAVRYVHHSIDADEVRRHIQGGKQCVRLAMTWADKISFELTEDLDIRKIRALDTLKENHPANDTDAEVFDADFLLIAGEIGKLLGDLIYALGGEKQVEEEKREAAGGQLSIADAGGPQEASDEFDPLYMEAVTLVRKHGRPSISHIQRHLRVGYNRAARLLQDMELAGLVSAMRPDGSRELRT